MDRFILHEIYGMNADDRKRFDLGQYADDGSILEDTVTGETYLDGWEPEDATFIRDLGWVPALLNTLAAETATQRAEIERLTAELEEARITLAAEKQRRSRMPSDNPDRLLAEVNAERIRRNLSWRDLATRLDVAPSTLTRWNNGRCPSITVYLNAREWLAVMRATADTYDASK